MDLIDFIYESNDAKNTEDLTRNFLAFLEGFGIDRFIMGEISHDSTSKKEKYLGLLVNYPQEWLDHYVANHYVDHDPVYQKALLSRKPFTWDEVKREDNSPRALQVMHEARECKLYSGIGISIHQPLGEIVGIGLAGSDQGVRCDKIALSMLHAASNQFFMVYADLLKIDDLSQMDVSITDREREVLLWVARGKTKPEISDILSVSESCVKRHCESIFKKLEVNNLSFAAVKALRMGLIKPF